ncbi:beta-1,3-galactosyltransferase 1-like [Micropterus salmoides]|uniref:beta-1,3-galactosyltransferase 1-like n=1 Tax=Micropterus salmoides TaxID=27706 RepID=UPI0018EA8BCF|nr:beta-1,3-galactosyltransferase 1-like [Micropterus salmoides]XP_038557941.1 beta-1,3-galactosyltransferase 1-like [Micropterus salmoides]XP_038557942.1 beta-1,3-galactosyltransferase 1-like [Micropterus salmoides]XP_038557943.1 beta-1,3-galactosyltransferase 1-like [Micropterus salmoides]
MLENGFAKRGKSQGMVDGGKIAESRRWFSWSRRHCFFFLLVLGAVLFLYNTNINDMASNWNPKLWLQYNASKWWSSFNSQTQNLASSSTPGPASEPVSASGFKAGTNSSAFSQTGKIPPTKVTKATTTTSVATQKEPVPPAPVPYVSPGPYLVEYPYKYHFVINEPKRCEQKKPYVVLMVPVAPHNKAHRDIIRSTWGGESLVLDKVVTLFFLLGLHIGEGAEQLQKELLQESTEHQDLIQSNFLDCYKNLTIKTMVMLEWLDTHCSSASYAMKIDSDMFLNVAKLINMLLDAPKTNYMSGLVARGGVVLRDRNSKWYVPEEIYPGSVYPRYALGLGYVLSLDLPKKLVEASRHIKAIYIEDVYLGLCMQHLGIPPTDPPDWGYFQVFPVQYSRCAYSKLIATTTHEHSDRVWAWKDFKKPGPYC